MEEENAQEIQAHNSEIYEVLVTGAENPSQNGKVIKLDRLSIHDSPFESTGVASVQVTKAGRPVTLEIPIKAVDIEDVEKETLSFKPKVPAFRDKIRGQWTTVVNEADPTYQQAQSDYMRRLSRTWVLFAIDVDISDDNGVVWSADNTVRDYDRAIAALKKMHLVENQLVSIFQDVQALTSRTEEAYDSD